MRVAKVSAFTSEPNLTIHRAPFASLIRTLGLDPDILSSTKLKGGLGAFIRPPMPPMKSRFSTAPGSDQITGVPTLGALGAFSSLEAFSFCDAADEMKPSATKTATSAPILRKFKVISVLLAMVFFWRARQMIFSYCGFCQQENVRQKNGGRKKYDRTRSSEKLLRRSEVDILRARSGLDVMEGAPRRRVLNPLRPVDAERRIDRAGDVFHIDRAIGRPSVINDLPAVFIGLADDRAAPDAAAGEHAGMNMHVMLAAFASLAQSPRSPAEFAHRDDQRLVEQRLARRVF